MSITIYTDPSSDDAPDYSPLTPAQLLANSARNYLRTQGINLGHVPDAELVNRIRRMLEPPKPRPTHGN